MRCPKEALEKEARPVKDEDDGHTKVQPYLVFRNRVEEDNLRGFKKVLETTFWVFQELSAVCCPSTKSSLNLSRKEVTGACMLTCSQAKE